MTTFMKESMRDYMLGGPHSLWTIPGGCGYCCFWRYSVTGRGYSDLQGRLHSAPQWGLTERRNHSNGTTTQQGVDFHSLITKKCIANAQSSYTTTGVRLYLFICYHGNKAAWQRCHIKDINCRNNVMKRWVLLNMAPVVQVERGWPWSHRWVKMLPLICSVQTPPKHRASVGVAQAIQKAKHGWASSIRACPPWPHPTCVRGSHHQHCRPGPGLDWGAPGFTVDASQGTATSTWPTAVLPNLAAQAPLGPAVQNTMVSAPMTGQLPPATGPVPKVQTETAPRMSLGHVPDQYHSPDSSSTPYR